MEDENSEESRLGLMPETRKKISESLKKVYSDKKNHPMFGRKHTEASKKLMSLAKKGKPSPKRGISVSEEQKRKQSSSMKGKFVGSKHPLFGKHHSEESKRKVGEKNSGKKRTKEVVEAIRVRMSGENNPNFGKKLSLERRKQIGEQSRGRHHTEEAKRKISFAFKGNKHPRYGVPRASGKITEYKGIFFKSSWEASIAKKMDELGLFWVYEPKRFYFSHKKFTYLPDFYIFDWATFLEVKGFWGLDSAIKIQSFKEETSENLLLVEEEHYGKCLNAKSVDEFRNACGVF